MITTGKLYVVATPIGNLEDITIRAIKTLGSVDILLCEDTRHTGLLLDRIPKDSQFKKPKLISYQEFNEQQRIPEIINQLTAGANIALVSDAGTPLISDPGFRLVNECIKRDITIVPIPGPSSVTAALSISGLSTNNFNFIGYLPQQKGKRKKILSSLNAKTTIVCYEAPHRLIETLNDIQAAYGNINIVICRELTKIYEETYRGRVSEALEKFKNPKGEFVILFNTLQALKYHQ